ncbi:MAG TPA: CvpA family protein [Flavobacterium sp.]|jgi:membrane protein required for colicin V production
MVFIDFVLGALLVYGIVRGLWNGFFVEFASLLSLLVGIWAAIKFSHIIRAIIEGHVSWNPRTIQLAAFALTFIVVVIGISLLAKFFTTIANFAGLGIFNKLAGAFFGLLKMTLILSVTLNLFAKLNSGEGLLSHEKTEKSLFYNPIRKTAAWIYPSIENWFTALKEKAV